MKKGFTLLEMIIVLSILTVLFILSVPNIQKVMHIVEDKGCDAQLKVIDSAIIEYKLLYNYYPTSMYELLNEGLITESQMQCQNGGIISIVDGQAYAN